MKQKVLYCTLRVKESAAWGGRIEDKMTIQEEIKQLKEEKDAVILAH